MNSNSSSSVPSEDVPFKLKYFKMKAINSVWLLGTAKEERKDEDSLRGHSSERQGAWADA